MIEDPAGTLHSCRRWTGLEPRQLPFTARLLRLKTLKLACGRGRPALRLTESDEAIGAQLDPIAGCQHLRREGLVSGNVTRRLASCTNELSFWVNQYWKVIW